MRVTPTVAEAVERVEPGDGQRGNMARLGVGGVGDNDRVSTGIGLLEVGDGEQVANRSRDRHRVELPLVR